MPDTMYVTPPCPMCGKRSNILLDNDKLYQWQQGSFVQNVWPEMSPADRETLITGTHPACWDQMFAGSEGISRVETMLCLFFLLIFCAALAWVFAAYVTSSP